MAPPNTAGQWKKQVAKGYELLSSVKLALGSEWTSTNTLTFRIICKKLGKETMPDFLLPYFTDAKNCVKNSTHMKKLCKVLKALWRDWSRLKLVEAGGVFGVFLCRLAEIRQVEAVVEPPTQFTLRPRAPPPSRRNSNAFDLSGLHSSLTGIGESSITNKSSDGSKSLSSSISGSSVVGSEYVEQSMYTAQIKSEVSGARVLRGPARLGLARPRWVSRGRSGGKSVTKLSEQIHGRP